MDAGVTVRPALAADLHALAPLIAALPVFAPYQFEAAALYKRWSEAMAQDAAALQVAESGGQAVGLCWYTPRGTFASGAYLRFLSVVPRAQGHRVGGLLLQQYEQACRGAPGGLFVLTSRHNTAAAAFYGHHGYAKVGELPDFAVSGVTELIYWKRLP